MDEWRSPTLSSPYHPGYREFTSTSIGPVFQERSEKILDKYKIVAGWSPTSYRFYQVWLEAHTSAFPDPFSARTGNLVVKLIPGLATWSFDRFPCKFLSMRGRNRFSEPPRGAGDAMPDRAPQIFEKSHAAGRPVDVLCPFWGEIPPGPYKLTLPFEPGPTAMSWKPSSLLLLFKKRFYGSCARIAFVLGAQLKLL